MKPMKQSFYTLMAVIFLVLCTACTQADIVSPVVGGDGSGQGNGDDPNKGAPLAVSNVRLSLEVESKSVVTGLPPAGGRNPNPLDKVAVCVVKSGSSGKQFYDPANPVQIFSYNDASTSWEQTEPASPLYLYTESGRGFVYAPADASLEVQESPFLFKGVVVKAAQTFRFHDDAGSVDPATDVPWDIDQPDYLLGKGGNNVNRWQPALELAMVHILAKVSFRVMEASPGIHYQGSKVAKVELKSSTNGFKTSTEAYMDPVSGDVGGTTNPTGTLTFTADPATQRTVTTGAASAATVPVQAFGLVLPVSGFEATLELTLDDGHVFASPLFDVNWVAGQNYIYTLTLSPKGITIDTPKVTNWEDATIPDPNVPMD